MERLPNLEELYTYIANNYSLAKALPLDEIQKLGFDTRETFETSSGINDAILADVNDAMINIYESTLSDEEKVKALKRDVTAFIDVFNFKKAASSLNTIFNRTAVITYKTFETFRDDVLDPVKEEYTLSSLVLKVIDEQYVNLFDITLPERVTPEAVAKIAKDIVPTVNTIIDDENDLRLERMEELIRPAIGGEEKYTISDADFKDIVSRMYIPHVDSKKVEDIINSKLKYRDDLLESLEKSKATLVDKESILKFLTQEELLKYDKDFFTKYSRENLPDLDVSAIDNLLSNVNSALNLVNADLDLRTLLKNVPIRDLTREQLIPIIQRLAKDIGQTEIQKLKQAPPELLKDEFTKKEFLSDDQISALRERCRFVLEAEDKKTGIVSDTAEIIPSDPKDPESPKMDRFTYNLPLFVSKVHDSISKWNTTKIKEFKNLIIDKAGVYTFKFPIKGLEDYQSKYNAAKKSGNIEEMTKAKADFDAAFDKHIESILIPEAVPDDLIIQFLKEERSKPIGITKVKPDYLEREQRHEEVGGALATAKQLWNLPSEIVDQLGDILEDNPQIIDLFYTPDKMQYTPHEYLTRVPSINLSIYDIEKVLGKVRNIKEQTKAFAVEKGESYESQADIDAMIKAARDRIMEEATAAGLIEYSGNLYALGPDQEAALTSIINKYIQETKGAMAMKKEAVYFNLFKEFDQEGPSWEVNKEQGVISKIDTALSIKESDLEDAVKNNGLWQYKVGEQLQMETETSTIPVTVVERLPNRQYKVITTAGNTQNVKESQLFNNTSTLFK